MGRIDSLSGAKRPGTISRYPLWLVRDSSAVWRLLWICCSRGNSKSIKAVRGISDYLYCGLCKSVHLCLRQWQCYWKSPQFLWQKWQSPHKINFINDIQNEMSLQTSKQTWNNLYSFSYLLIRLSPLRFFTTLAYLIKHACKYKFSHYIWSILN